MKKYLSLILFVFLFAEIVSAQTTGSSCSVPIDLGHGDTCTPKITISRTQNWYAFVANNLSATIKLTSYSDFPGIYDKLFIYSGTCGSLTLLDSALLPTGDSVITLTQNYLVTGSTYFLKATMVPYHSGTCRTCIDSTVTSSICVKQQGNPPFCGFDFSTGVHTIPQVNSPAQNAQEQYIYNYVHSHSSIAGPFTIPVVVHVLHFGDAYGTGNNISYDQIRWQIAALNAAYQHAYATYNQQGYGEDPYNHGHQDYSSNPQVRFCLAHIGRDSLLNQIPFYYNTTTADTECGVVRYDLTQSPYSSIPNVGTLNEYQIDTLPDEQALMAVTRPAGEFPNDMYFNIYLVPDMCPGGAACNSVVDTIPSIVGVGFMMPSQLTGRLDGVVFRSDVFGDNSVVGNNFPLFSQLNQGKIMDHEAGHYLSLWHTFQPDSTFTTVGCYGNMDSLAVSDRCDGHGDFCCDTPPDTTAFVQANPVIFNYYNSCNENYFPPSYTDHYDMVEDYMDYMDDETYNSFTYDQSMRISAMLDVGGPRHSLVTSTNLTLTGVSNTGPCTCCMLVAHIVPQADTLCVGATVNFFTPSGVGLCANSWSWSFPGGTPSTGTGTTPSTSYGAPGTYLVYLTASDGTNNVTDSAYITIIIPTVTITHTNTNLTVCDGTHQNLYLHFTGNLPPYSVSICNDSSIVVATYSGIINDSAIVLVPVGEGQNTFHICSATNGLGCNVDTIVGTASFNVRQCCTNLFKNGDFEDAGTPGCYILPATTQQQTSSTCNQYSPSYYGIYNPLTAFGGWPHVPGNDGVNGLSMAIDGWISPQNPSQTPPNTDLWCSAATLDSGATYSIQFDYSGDYSNLYQGDTPPQPWLNLFLQLKINGVFIGSPIAVPDCSTNTPWHTFVMDWTSSLPTGSYQVCLCQVEVPSTGYNFGLGSFDFLIDNLTMSGKYQPVCNAGADVRICPGDSALIGSITDTLGIYSWSPIQPVSCDTCPVTYASPDSTQSFVLTAFSGCIVHDTVQVSVFDVSLGNDHLLCHASSDTLVATTSGGSGSYSYLWSTGDTTATITVNPSVPTTYIVTVTDDSLGCSDSDTIVVINSHVQVTVAGASICSGGSATLTASVTGAIGTVDYVWSTSDTTSSITVSPTASTTYTLIVTDSTGCSDTTTVSVNVLSSPIADAGIDAAVCPGQSIVIGEVQQPSYTISWTPSSTLNSSTVQNPLATPTVTTDYIITVTDGNGCTGTDTVRVTILSSALCSNCLVPNPGFETLTTCPTGLSQLPLAQTWSWATLGSADVDNTCATVGSSVNVPTNTIFGNVPVSVSPPGGNGYAGIRTYGNSDDREYVETRLNCKLDSGQRYQIGFYARVAPNCTNGYNNIGMYLSSTPAYAANVSTPLSVTPQINRTTPLIDANGWTFIGNTNYLGNNERYVTIGNFFNDASTTSASNGTGGTLTFGYYFIDNVVAVPKSPSVSASATSICSGSSVTLTASGSPAYDWFDGTTHYSGSSHTFNPTTTTTYTLTAVLSCSLCDPVDTTITITVNPPPTVDAGADIIACGGDTVHLFATPSGTGPFTYSWTPSTGLNSTTVQNPYISSYNGNAITYSVIVTDANGCTAIDSVHVKPDPACCTAQNYAPNTLNNYSISGSTLAINQNLTFTGINTISATDVRIRTGVKITVSSGATLRILNKAHLHACDQMWQGIVVLPGGHLIMDNNPLIEDAYIAVKDSTPNGSSSITLDSAIFNKNQIAVLIKSWTGVTNFAMRNCRVTCRVLPSIPTVGLLTSSYLTGLTTTTMIAPLNTKRSFAGVELMNGGSVLVGAVGRKNIFDYLDNGIIASNTNVESRNNLYQNMLQPCAGPPSCPTSAGIAIVASDPTLVIGNPATYNAIIVGGSAATSNSFINCYRAIDITKYAQVKITRDTITSSATVISPATTNLNGDHGIFIRTIFNQAMKIDSNLIVNQATGIHVILGTDTLGYNTININWNTVKAGTSSTTFTNKGIQVEGVIGVYIRQNNYLNIAHDSVLLAKTCIQVRTIRDNIRIFENPDLYVRPITTAAAGIDQAGILVENCHGVMVLDNPLIHSTGTTYSNINHRNVRGIYMRNTTLDTLCSNYTRSLGQCIVFEGTCSQTTMRRNDMALCYDGYVLRNNGIVGPQGNSTHPIDNRWLTGFVFSQTFTDNTINCNSASPIWVRSTGVWNPINNQSNVGFPYIPNTIGSAFIPATCPPAPINVNLLALRHQIAQNQINYVIYPAEGRIMERRRLLRDLQANPSLLIGDTILTNFYNANINANLGKMNGVEDAVTAGDVTTAVASNAAIVPATNTEYNQKQFNDIFLSTLMLGIDSLDAQQISDLTAIAEQCPTEGGDAVWQARAMLNWVLHTNIDFTDSCSSSSSRFASAESEHHCDGCKVFPNPNAGTVTVEYKLDSVTDARFELMDLTGQIIFSKALDPNATSLQIEFPEIANGAYMYRITGDAEIKDTGLLIISK